ncbi:hypothetical protein TNIN_308931 [Trichonephila inaurata madagascariensis]|uniref:Uncharacterized protein n=1 Tax=Trichonephila inaurata madagascariensis TaxID=2747483 RepID=A0A8X7CR79_9ARAC|nr:hypothetical protein TNIN_308931 [Trichonephila inaurata madagascariensis]
MDALKLRRTPLRTAFTKGVNHLQVIIENDPVDMNAVETAFEQLKAKEGSSLKDISIPFGVIIITLGTRLAASVKNDLNLPDVRIYYLTDSMAALAWIQLTRDWGYLFFKRVKKSKPSDVVAGNKVPSEKFADILFRGKDLELVPRPTERNNGVTGNQDPTVGEVVVVENSLKEWTLWSLARVIQLIPGKVDTLECSSQN